MTLGSETRLINAMFCSSQRTLDKLSQGEELSEYEITAKNKSRRELSDDERLILKKGL